MEIKYQPIPIHEKREILASIFDKELTYDQKNLMVLSSVHNFEAEFFVEIFKKIIAGKDVQLKLAALRATPEAIQSTGYIGGIKTFIIELHKFKKKHKSFAVEIEDILNEVQELNTIFTSTS